MEVVLSESWAKLPDEVILRVLEHLHPHSPFFDDLFDTHGTTKDIFFDNAGFWTRMLQVQATAMYQIISIKPRTLSIYSVATIITREALLVTKAVDAITRRLTAVPNLEISKPLLRLGLAILVYTQMLTPDLDYMPPESAPRSIEFVYKLITTTLPATAIMALRYVSLAIYHAAEPRGSVLRDDKASACALLALESALLYSASLAVIPAVLSKNWRIGDSGKYHQLFPERLAKNFATFYSTDYMLTWC